MPQSEPFNSNGTNLKSRTMHAVPIGLIHPLQIPFLFLCYSRYSSILIAVQFISTFQNSIHPIAWNINSTHSTVWWTSRSAHQMTLMWFWPVIQMKHFPWLKSSSVAGEIRNQLFATTKRNPKCTNVKHPTFWMLANIVAFGCVSLKASSPLDVKMRQPPSYRGKIQIRSMWTSSVCALAGEHPAHGSLKVNKTNTI